MRTRIKVGEIKIRKYRESDKAAVIGLHYLALKAAGAPKRKISDEDLEHIREVYFGSGEFLVGEIGGEIIAMGGLMRVSENIARIRRMRVHPKFQRRGYGQMILSLLEKKAKELGYKRLVLETHIEQKAAQGLYKRNGFIEVKRDKIAEANTVQISYEKEI